MKPHSVLPCLFLPPWCPGELSADLTVTWSDGRQAVSLPLAEALSTLSSGPLALVVPVEHVASCAVELPPGSAHLQRQALPFAVEPLLGEDIEAVHLVQGELLADGRHRVAAINQALLEGWLVYLRQAGVQITAINVDADLLPSGSTALYWEVERCLLATADGERMAFAAAQVGQALAALTTHCRVFHGPDAAPILPADRDLSWEVLDLPVHAWLVRQQPQALDLAQGPFAAKPPMSMHRWRPVAIALALVVLAQLAFDGAQLWLLNQQASGYRQVNEAIYKGLFPAETRIVNLKAQFDQHLREGASTSRFSTLLGIVAGVMPADGALQARKVAFQTSSGQLVLELQGGDEAAYKALQQRLEAAGVKVTGVMAQGGMQVTVEQGQ
jgi:general secretion pathway protein L